MPPLLTLIALTLLFNTYSLQNKITDYAFLEFVLSHLKLIVSPYHSDDCTECINQLVFVVHLFKLYCKKKAIFTNLAGEKKGDILEKITFFVLSDFFLNLLFSHIQIFQLLPFFHASIRFFNIWYYM
jgi:hypothetical protein